MKSPICKKCDFAVPAVNAQGICRNCMEQMKVKHRCKECGHCWEHPGLACFCPLCGSVNGVTTDDDIVDGWIWKKYAEDHWVIFRGIQKGTEEIPDTILFEDPITKSTFVLHSGETMRDALRRVRESFGLGKLNATN